MAEKKVSKAHPAVKRRAGVPRVKATMTGKEFHERYDTMMRAVSTSESRFNLNCVYLNGPKGEVVGTDGHRLAIAPLHKSKHTSMVSRADFALALKTISRKASETVKIRMTAKLVTITTGRGPVKMMWVPGDYPDYHKIFDGLTGTSLTVPTAELKHAVKLCRILTPDRNRGFQMALEAGRILFHAVHPDLGEVDHWMAADVPADLVGQKLLLNADYVLQAMNGHPTMTVTVPKERGPIGLDSYYVMPMRF